MGTGGTRIIPSRRISPIVLLIGGVFAAPLGAWAAKAAPPKVLLVFVGAVLTLTSLYGVYTALA